MAQTVDYYVGKATGGATLYYYKDANAQSTAIRIYSGTQVRLYHDFLSSQTNGFYPIFAPGSGWMYSYNITDITPVYQTVPDACTAPKRVTVDRDTKVMTVEGGAGGDLNTLVAFGVSWRERVMNETEWGPWSEDIIITSPTATMSVNTGMVRQFRVRSRGSAGEAYFSGYTACSSVLVGNSAAPMPVVALPDDGLTTLCMLTRLVVECAADPEGDTQTLKRSIDGANFTTAATLTGAARHVDRLPVQQKGKHIINYKLVDANGAESDVVGVTVVVAGASWARTLAAGNIVANPSISHQADLRELKAAVDQLRAYYGLGPCVLPGVIGRFSDWQKQVQAMQAAIDETRAVINMAGMNWPAVPAWPGATVLAHLRVQCMVI